MPIYHIFVQVSGVTKCNLCAYASRYLYPEMNRKLQNRERMNVCVSGEQKICLTKLVLECVTNKE